MKNMQLLTVLVSLATLVCCSGKEETKPVEPEEPAVKEYVSDGSWNGDFVIALAKAYDVFAETDELPATINVQGMKFGIDKYTAGAGLLLEKMTADPEHWQEQDIDVPAKCGAGRDDKNNTFFADSLSLKELTWLYRQMSAYAAEHSGVFPNYVTFPESYVEEDGTKHDAKLTFNNTAVVFARLFKEFTKTSSFPAKVSSWQSDFLHKTSHCETDSPVVLEAMKVAVSGNTTVREKAEALFNYSRDEWEWLNYMNTRKGSVQTIQEKSGNCCDLSHALIAMCRAAGIPARYMHGQCQFSSAVIGHVFVEMYVDGVWYICDPSNNANTFGHHNWKHMDTFNGRYKTLPF